jgi:hypothetical protein
MPTPCRPEPAAGIVDQRLRRFPKRQKRRLGNPPIRVRHGLVIDPVFLKQRQRIQAGALHHPPHDIGQI